MAMLTIVLATYGQPQMLAFQLAEIESYPDRVLDCLTVVVVDDHGDPPVAIKAMKELQKFCKVVLLRSVKDVPWHQMGARNAGMRVASGICVMLDVDMLIERHVIGKFLARAKAMKRGQVVKFALKHPDPKRELDFSSPNTWMLHRDDFFACGGYDEDFAGNKGWSDCLLQETLRAFYEVQMDDNLYVDFQGAGLEIPDAQVKVSAGVGRSVKVNKELKRRKNRVIELAGGHRDYIRQGKKGRNFRCPVTRLL